MHLITMIRFQNLILVKKAYTYVQNIEIIDMRTTVIVAKRFYFLYFDFIKVHEYLDSRNLVCFEINDRNSLLNSIFNLRLIFIFY